MASGHRWNKVGDEFVQLFMSEYERDGALHWPTVIAATSCLCGETALVGNESRLPEFGVIESSKVADFMHNGDTKNSTIWGYSTAIAKQAFNVEAEHLPVYLDLVKKLGMQLLPGSFPALDVSAHVMPHETPMNAGPRLRKRVHEIAQKEGFSTTDSSFALATAAMKMIGSAQALGVRELTNLALQCSVAGSRFAPTLEPVPNPAFQRIAGDGPEQIFHTPSADVEPSTPAAAAVAAALAPSGGGFGKRR